MLTINEIFFSIQGESTYVGEPCVFVRLSGCDLRCTWCDTAYAFHEGKKLTVDDVVRQVRSHNCAFVEITGGEPLLQDDVYPLMGRLLGLGKTVLLETGGHVRISQVPPEVIKIIDIKCPSSGESSRTEWSNFTSLSPRDEIKFVIKDREDYEFARKSLSDLGLGQRCHRVLFSPVHGELAPEILSAWLLEDRLPVRLQLQLHKIIWGPSVRGV